MEVAMLVDAKYCLKRYRDNGGERGDTKGRCETTEGHGERARAAFVLFRSDAIAGQDLLSPTLWARDRKPRKSWYSQSSNGNSA